MTTAGLHPGADRIAEALITITAAREKVRDSQVNPDAIRQHLFGADRAHGAARRASDYLARTSLFGRARTAAARAAPRPAIG